MTTVGAYHPLTKHLNLVAEYSLVESESHGTLSDSENNRLTIGAYHPLTKHLNLVAEFSKVEAESHNGLKNEEDKFSLGAILFF